MLGITESWRLIWYKNLRKVMCITEVIPGNVDMLFSALSENEVYVLLLTAHWARAISKRAYTGYTAVRLIARTVRAVTKGRIGIAYNTGGYESLAVTRESMGIDMNCDLGFCDWMFFTNKLKLQGTKTLPVSRKLYL